MLGSGDQFEETSEVGTPDETSCSGSECTLAILNEQAIAEGIPEYDDYEAQMKTVVSCLDILDPNRAFDRIHRTVRDLHRPEYAMLLWERCLDEVSHKGVSLNTQFFKVRVEYHLSTGIGAIDALKELVGAYKDRPNVLQEAARMRYLLARETAQRAYTEVLEKAEAERDAADENYWSLIETKYKTERSGPWIAFGPSYVDEQGGPREDLEQAIEEALHVLKDAEAAESELRRSGYEPYYRDEVRFALDWALEAQKLDANNASLRELITEMQGEVGLGAQPLVPDAEIIAQIEGFVQEDQLKEALTKLCSLDACRYDAILLTRRLKRIRRQERQGTVTRDEAKAERAGIAESILGLISS